jgi:hypothetical protein
MIRRLFGNPLVGAVEAHDCLNKACCRHLLEIFTGEELIFSSQ